VSIPQGHRAPASCPVCAAHTVVTSLGCRSCGTELVGEFARCEFCSLQDAELELLRVFLAARGNLRQVAKHEQVSYPTARARLTKVLDALGLAACEDGADTERAAVPSREQLLSEVASGALSPQEAAGMLDALPVEY